MFNKFIWDTYLRAGGNDTVELFLNLIEGEYSKDVGIRYISSIETLHSSYCPCKPKVNETSTVLNYLVDDIDKGCLVSGC